MEVLVILFILGCMGASYCLLMIGSINGILGKRLQLSLGHNSRYSKHYDKVATETFKAYRAGNVGVQERNYHTIKFSNGVVMWVANKYFGYGTICKISDEIQPDHRISVKNALTLVSIENNTFTK